jgi:outer membrane lipoprotein carrier protein
MQIKSPKSILLTVLACWASMAFASPVDELTTLLLSFQIYKANFSQQTFDQNGEKLQHLTGIMILQKPDHFYWESDEPYAQKLVSNGKNIWHYDADLEQVVIQEYAKQAQQAPVLVILRDPASLGKSFRIAHVNRKDNKVQFQLEALEKNATLKEVELGFSSGVLSQLGFTDSLQQKTSIDFSAPVLNEKTETSRFEFILPEGVDVLYE